MKTFKVLSALLSYPTEALIEAGPDLLTLLDAEKLLPAAIRGAVGALIGEIAVGDVYDLQERYGLLFDRSKTLALHLFEHDHG
jgi:nitrate reductase delta subunit